MATDLKGTTARNTPVSLTQFCGTNEEGLCLQLTPSWNTRFVSLTKEQALELASALNEWAAGVREEE